MGEFMDKLQNKRKLVVSEKEELLVMRAVGSVSDTEMRLIKVLTNYEFDPISEKISTEPQSVFITDIERKLDSSTIYEINIALAYLESKRLVREKSGIVEATDLLIDFLQNPIPF